MVDTGSRLDAPTGRRPRAPKSSFPFFLAHVTDPLRPQLPDYNGAIMQFLSRFSKSRDATKNHRRHSTPPPKTQSQVASSYLPLSLPSSSLLRDESLAIPLGTTSEDASDDVTEPWVEVAHGGDASSPIKPRPTDLGTTGVERTSARAEDPIKKRREVIKLERSRVPIEQMITLMDECGDVIRTRGLTTLGIFRPYRLSESPSEIRQLCLLFLDYCAEFDLRVPPSSTRGTRASKTVKLHRFKEELRYTEIHNVVAVLKWVSVFFPVFLHSQTVISESLTVGWIGSLSTKPGSPSLLVDCAVRSLLFVAVRFLPFLSRVDIGRFPPSVILLSFPAPVAPARVSSALGLVPPDDSSRFVVLRGQRDDLSSIVSHDRLLPVSIRVRRRAWTRTRKRERIRSRL